MRKLSMVLTATVAAILVVAIPAAATNTVKIKSSITLSPYATQGKISSPNKACISGRKVVVKVRDARGKLGVYGRDTTEDNGKYKIEPGPLSGPLPYTFFAVAKARSEGAAGTIFVCGKATSKTRVISGG